MNIDEIISGLKSGSRRALAKAISIIENRGDEREYILKALDRSAGNSIRVGITGHPGAGKSTLADCLISKFRDEAKKVGVISVDPTSPFTGGAILGDRVRMTRYYQDEGVFIRSMATRGSLGGLAQSSLEVADLLTAAGFDIILFETVGVGQIELDIIHAADAIMVVFVPEAGDDIQTMKAGLMEIADIFVVNKSDRKNAEQMAMYIRTHLELVKDKLEWVPPVINTIASHEKGIDELYEELNNFIAFSRKSGLFYRRRKKQLEDRVKGYIQQRLAEDFWTPARERELKTQLQNDPEEIKSTYEIGDNLMRMK